MADYMLDIGVWVLVPPSVLYAHVTKKADSFAVT